MTGLGLAWRREEVDLLIRSQNREERILGLRLLAWVHGDDLFVHSKAMEIIGSSLEREELTAALSSLRLCQRAHKLLSIEDLRVLVGLLQAATRDVRIAACEFFGAYRSHSDDTIAALGSYCRASRDSDEYSVATLALAMVGMEGESGQTLLLTETEEALRALKSSFKKDRVDAVSVLLRSLEHLDVSGPDSLQTRIQTLFRNYRAPADLRRNALAAFTAVCTVDSGNTKMIVGLLKAVPAGMIAATPRAVQRYLSRCRRRLEYFRQIQELLPDLVSGLVEYYERHRNTSEAENESLVKHVRAALTDVEFLLYSREDILPGLGQIQLPLLSQ